MIENKNLFLTRILVLLTLLGCSLKAQDVQLPSSFKVCPKASPNLAACVKNSVEHLRSYLKSGDLGNGFKVVPIEPIAIDDIHLERGSGFYFYLDNVRAYKISNFIIEKLRVNADTLNTDLLLTIPKVEAYSDYKINLMLGILAIRGQGKVKGLIDEVRVKAKLEMTPTYKNGVEYKKITKVTVHIQLKNLVLKIDDLFKDKLLNDVGEGLVNQNLPMFLPEIEKSVQNSLTRIVFQTGNGIVDRIPYHQLLS